MDGKARILTYGFSAEEQGRIDAALAAVGVPPPTRMRATQGHVVLSDIILRDQDGTEGIACPERLVLFHNLSEGGIRTLMSYIRRLELPRPIFAVVTETSFRWTLAELLEHVTAERRLEVQRAADKRLPEEGGGEIAGGEAGAGEAAP